MNASRLTPKEPRVFSREEPCTKVHLFNCFHQNGRYVRRAVIEARGEIGLNAIKYLKREEYARVFAEAGVEYWELTRDGQAWLTAGLERHLELHPEDRASVNRGGRVSPTTRRVPRTR